MSIIEQLALCDVSLTSMRDLFRDGRDAWIADLFCVARSTVGVSRQRLGAERHKCGGHADSRSADRREFDRRWGWLRERIRVLQVGGDPHAG